MVLYPVFFLPFLIVFFPSSLTAFLFPFFPPTYPPSLPPSFPLFFPPSHLPTFPPSYTEACAVEAARGSWWLQQSRATSSPAHPAHPSHPSQASHPSSSSTSSGISGSIEFTPNTPSGVEIVKAMRWYQLAGDLNRCNALLDRAMWHCCTATVNASKALSLHNNTIQTNEIRDNDVNMTSDYNYSSSSSNTESYSFQDNLNVPVVPNQTSDTSKTTRMLLPLISRGMQLYPEYPRRGEIIGEMIGDNSSSRGSSSSNRSSGSDYWDLRHYSEGQSSGRQREGDGVEDGYEESSGAVLGS